MTPLDLAEIADVARRPWRNDGGSARDLQRRPAGCAGHHARRRASLADIDGDGPFPAGRGVERRYVVVEAGARQDAGVRPDSLDAAAPRG